MTTYVTSKATEREMHERFAAPRERAHEAREGGDTMSIPSDDTVDGALRAFVDSYAAAGVSRGKLAGMLLAHAARMCPGTTEGTQARMALAALDAMYQVAGASE